MAAAAPTPSPFPPLVVFDLDWTLWPLDVDTHCSPPFTTTPSGSVRDRHGSACELFPDTRAVLARLAAGGSQVAFASRTTDPEAAEALLRAHGLWGVLQEQRDLFQAYPSGGRGAKTRHFAAIFGATGWQPADTLFFDDMHDNVEVATRAGVTCVLLERGITLQALESGLAAWRAQKR